jgi:hypothetical protein
MEQTTETTEAWELVYAFSEYGSATVKCSSLEDCKRALVFYMRKAGKQPLWAKALCKEITTVTSTYELT